MNVLPLKRAKARLGETTLSTEFIYRLSSTEDGITTVLMKTPDLQAARRMFEEEADKARKAGSRAHLKLDQFRREERETWTTRLNWSQPPKPPVVLHTGKRGKLKILFCPFEIPQWVAARGWDYAANLAYPDTLRAMGHEVTVLNTLTIQWRELLNDKKFDQVWTHVHFRHATDHYYREWLADAAPIRVGLVGESVFFDEQEKLSSPWYAEMTKAWADWKPFLTHAALVVPSDARRVVAEGFKNARAWPQAVPRRMVLEPRDPRVERGVFIGAAYPPRDQWIWNPCLRDLLVKPVAPEGEGFAKKWERAHSLVGAWVNGIGTGSTVALSVYHRRLSQLRRRSLKAFIGAIGQGACVVNLPSMVKTYGSRVVEGMSSGRPVLSWAPSEAGLFEPGKEIVHYGDSPEELAEGIRRLIASPKESLAIAERARKAVLAGHTVEQRVAEILEWVTS